MAGLGEFSSGGQIGDPDDTQSDYRIGMTGAEMMDMGLTELRITTASGYEQVFIGPFDTNAFDNTCTGCNCGGNALSSDLFWSGGRGGCYGSTHFGLSRDGDIHVECGSSGGEADKHWGHFHRGGVNTGVYVFGDDCINEIEWDEVFSLYGKFDSSTTTSNPLAQWGVDYTPSLDYYGSDEIKYKVVNPNNDNGESEDATISISINPINDAPTMDFISDARMDEDGSVSVEFNASDPDNELTFSGSLALNSTDTDPSSSIRASDIKSMVAASLIGLILIDIVASSDSPLSLFGFTTLYLISSLP
jgi:hypothetical protein